jgi:hypothetical protein
VHLRRFFVIAQFKPRVIEGPQIVPELLESFFLADSRKQLLSHHAHQLRPSIADELSQCLCQCLFSRERAPQKSCGAALRLDGRDARPRTGIYEHPLVLPQLMHL